MGWVESKHMSKQLDLFLFSFVLLCCPREMILRFTLASNIHSNTCVAFQEIVILGTSSFA